MHILLDLVRRHKAGERVGVTSVCSAHPLVIEAALRHASATGRFDDEQLFYLQSRGIREDEARRLVVRGFLSEIVQQIGVPDLEERLQSAIEAELAGTTTRAVVR